MLTKLRHHRHCRNKGYYYVAEGVIITLWLAATVVLNAVAKPHLRGFFCDDRSIMYPYLPNTVPDAVIVVLTLGLPIVIMAVMEVVSRLLARRTSRTRQRSGSSIVRGEGGGPSGCCWVVRAYVIYFSGYIVMTLAVTILKLATGALRPNFVAVCQPNVLTPTAPPCRGQYITEFNCTKTLTEHDLYNARMSFPSGHAAYAAFTAVFMILYVERKVVTRHLHLVKLTFHALMTLYALWVGVSRVIDNMHHVRDVVFGTALGMFVALGSFYGAVMRIDHEETSEEGDSSNNMTGMDTAMNNNNNRSDDEDDVENGHLDALEIETPTTPTPLLFNGVSLTTNSGLRIGPLRLEGDKHKFSRRATLQ